MYALRGGKVAFFSDDLNILLSIVFCFKNLLANRIFSFSPRNNQGKFITFSKF